MDIEYCFLNEYSQLNLINVDELDDAIYLYCNQKDKFAICPICGRTVKRVNMVYKRKIQDVPINGKTTYLIVDNLNFLCSHDQITFNQHLNFAEKKFTITNRLKKFILEQSKNLSIRKAETKLNAMGVNITYNIIQRIRNSIK